MRVLVKSNAAYKNIRHKLRIMEHAVRVLQGRVLLLQLVQFPLQSANQLLPNQSNLNTSSFTVARNSVLVRLALQRALLAGGLPRVQRSREVIT